MASLLTVQEISSLDGFLSLKAEWKRMATLHGNSLPFAQWEWHDAWWRHHRRDLPLVGDTLSIRAVRTEAGELVGIAPLMLTRRPSRSAFALRALDFLGGKSLTELPGILCDPAREEEVHRVLLAHLTEHGAEWDWVSWCGLRAGSLAERLITLRPGVKVVEERHSHVLALPGSWEAFKASRSRNLKEAIRKCYNSLQRDGHAFALEVAAGPGEIPGALERFFSLHRARAAQQTGVRHVDAFSDAAARRFLTDLCVRLAPGGGVRIFEARVGPEIVASRVAFAVGDSLYFYYSGYDPRWARYSIMTTTLAEAIRWAIGAGFHSVNLSIGTDTSKTRWRPERIAYRTAVQTSRSVRGRLAHLAWRCVEVLTRSSWRHLLTRRWSSNRIPDPESS